MATKEEEIGAALMLLFDGMKPEKIAGALHDYLQRGDKPLWPVLNAIDVLQQHVSLYSMDVDGFINDMMEEEGQTYTGTREHLYSKLQCVELSDRVYEEMRGTKEEIINELTEEGFVREFRHHDGCPANLDYTGQHWRCTCESEAEEEVRPAA